MLIEDKGALAALKAKMQEDRRIKSGADLNVGDIVYQDMDRNDGLVLNKGYDNRLNYKGILTKDSRLDCAQLFQMKAKKSIAMKAECVGHLTEEDEAKILPLVASCGFIDTHMKKVYRIGKG